MAIVRGDPYPSRNFRVRLSDDLDPEDVRAQFSEVSGLGVKIDVVEYRAGNQKTASARKLPGRIHYRNVVLERGVIGDLSLWEWIKVAAQGAPEKRTVLIELLDEDREPVLVWKLRDAWPCRYDGPTLDADGSSVALETLEICHEGIRLE